MIKITHHMKLWNFPWREALTDICDELKLCSTLQPLKVEIGYWFLTQKKGAFQENNLVIP
jgi:beta-lactamase class A